MDTMDGLSMDLEQTNLDRLRAVFPECFAEGRLDIDKLLALCGEYIDNDFEKYRFEWKGKAECLRLAQKRSAGTLRPCPGESVNWDSTQNLYIEGDNLEVLKLLQSAYYRKVKMIYIDPPYNTGNDFVYADDFADPLARYKEVTAQTTKSNPETMGRFHTNWLNMMYPRLRLAANLLRDDGVIFISIDENEIVNLRKLCDEVFGEENFVAQITLLCNPKGRSQDMYVANCHEYVLVYSKSVRAKGSLSIPKNADDIASDYTLKDQNGAYRELELRNTHRDFGKFNRPNLYYPLFVNGQGNVSLTQDSEYETAVYPIWNDGFEGCWTWGQEKSKENIHLLTAKKVDGAWKIYRKAYALLDGEEVKKQVKSIWNDAAFYTEKGQRAVNELFETKEKLFQAPKSPEMIKQTLLMAQTESDDIILDFFSGSATTAHAVMQLNAEDGGNRRFIMVQLPEVCDEKSEAYKAGYKNICEIGKERIRKAGEKIQTTLMEDGGDFRHLAKNYPSAGRKEINIDGHSFNVPIIPARWSKADESGENAEMANALDIGFRVFKLDSSNLKTWDATPIEGEALGTLYERMNSMVQRVKQDRSDLDMVFEVMLKLGVPPTYAVTPVTINGKTAYSVGDDCLLLICLAPDIRPEDVEQMAEYAPAKVILSRESFAGDTAMSNAFYILRDRGVELKLV